MPQDYLYTNANLPEYFEHQIRDFIRIHWYDVFQFDVHARSAPDEFKPIHFIVGDAPALYSHAAVVSCSIIFNGVEVSCGGLSSVLTYPAFRAKGYGRHVVQLATAYLKSQPFDIGLLWTDPKNTNFYAASGWQHYENITCQKGEKERLVEHGLYSMLLILSEKAQNAMTQAQNHTIYIGEQAW